MFVTEAGMVTEISLEQKEYLLSIDYQYSML